MSLFFFPPASLIKFKHRLFTHIHTIRIHSFEAFFLFLFFFFSLFMKDDDDDEEKREEVHWRAK